MQDNVASKPETPRQADSGITSLSDTQSGSRKWFDAVAKLIADVADALEYAHGRGVIHRDIKPANLMLSKEGRLCVTDFGLARVAQEPGMTVSGSLLGTPAYMSPEQIATGRVKLDHRTDVYSLGTVLYEMLAQRRPFPGDNREEVLSGILTKDPRPPRRFNPRVPLDLETIALKAMEKDPDRRYATAGELAQDLKQYLGRRTDHGPAGRNRAANVEVDSETSDGDTGGRCRSAAHRRGLRWSRGRRGDVAKEAQRLVADARLAFGEGDRNGLQLIDRAVALDPDSLEARLVRARLLIVNYRYYEAADEARSVETLQVVQILVAAQDSQSYASRRPDDRLIQITVDVRDGLACGEASFDDHARDSRLSRIGGADQHHHAACLGELCSEHFVVCGHAAMVLPAGPWRLGSSTGGF